MKEELTHKLTSLSRFENLFNRENLQLGVTMWMKTYGISTIVQIVAALSGIISALGSISLLLLFAFQIYLFQWASSTEARKKYNIKLLPSAWWSIIWRINVFLLPVWILFVFLMPEGYATDIEKIQANPVPFQSAQMILLLLAVIPLGMITTKSFLISYNRIKQLAEFVRKQEEPENTDSTTSNSDDGESN